MKFTLNSKKSVDSVDLGQNDSVVVERTEINTMADKPMQQTRISVRSRLANRKVIQDKFLLMFEGSKSKMILYSIILLVLIFGIAFFSIQIIDYKKFIPIDTSVKTLELPVTASSAPNRQILTVPVVPTLRDQENPVNGVMVTQAQMDAMKARKLVVVSINNHTRARPQFGLSRADLVLEVLAEGGITRYNAYYYQDQEVPKIGPVRSARSYMLYNLSGYDDPVFVHEGQASYPPQEKAIAEINTLKQIHDWHIRDMQTSGALYRDPVRKKQRGSVHSLMTGFSLINKEVKRLKWNVASNITPLKFKYDAPVEARGVAVEASSDSPAASSAKKIEVRFSSIGGKSYWSSFDYDADTNTYLRSIGGVADTDANDGSRIAPRNVIVEYHNYRDAMDGHSRIIIDMLGQGEVFVFRDGLMIKGTWKKSTRTERTKYYDAAGNEIELNRGQIWLVNAIRTKTHKVSDTYVNGKKV